MILTNARLIFRDGIREGLELVVEKGRISAIRERSRARANEVLDLHGNYLAAGFIDLHVHGALGRDSMEASAEAFQAICDYHASGGTTSLLLTTATAPLDRITDVLNVVRDCIPRPARRSSHTISQIAGVHVEGPCMSSARRRGIYRVGGLLEFALSEPQIGCELIADGRHVSGTLMKMLYHAKGPDGICLVTDASAGSGLPNGSHFSLFGKDCIVEDGVCLLADRSALAGSASRMIELVCTMVMEVNVPLHEAVVMATENPARAIGLETKGRLEVGADADLVVLSPELEVVRTLAAGEESWSH